jgi:IS5 family transposase
MHQTRKGNQYHFGAKAHIGVDSKETVVHSVCTSAASVHDKHMLPDSLHGEERKVWGDVGYQGQTKVIHEAAPHAQDMTNRRVKTKHGVDEDEKRKNRTKSRVRAKVEWPFRILKRVFGYTKVRYRGIVKNHHWHLAAFALVNLYQHRKQLIRQLAPLGAKCLRRPANGLRRRKTWPRKAYLPLKSPPGCGIASEKQHPTFSMKNVRT